MKVWTMVEVAIPEAALKFYVTRDPSFWEAYAAEYVGGLLREETPGGYGFPITFNSEESDRRVIEPDIEGPLTYRDPDWWKNRPAPVKTVKRKKPVKHLKNKRK